MIENLLLVGCGKMGSALLGGWDAGMQGGIHVVEPDASHRAALQEKYPRIRCFASLEEVSDAFTPDAVLFAVKPQLLEGVLPAYATRFGTAPLYLTIAAGKETAYYKKTLGADARIVRAMPNTPAVIQEGMTVLYATPSVTPSEREAAQALFDAVGWTAMIEDEQLMHIATALSGSGPAYVFLFLDTLIQAGIKAGLGDVLARTLAIKTLLGSATYAIASGNSLTQLRNDVTSPGGTTEAGLRPLLEGDALANLLESTLQNAVVRSKELAE